MRQALYHDAGRPRASDLQVGVQTDQSDDGLAFLCPFGDLIKSSDIWHIPLRVPADHGQYAGVCAGISEDNISRREGPGCAQGQQV